MSQDRYREAGVDIAKGNQFVKNIGEMVRATHTSGVLSDLGGFAGMMALPLDNLREPVLVTSTDGVGTKLKIAFLMNKHDTVGIDLVAMCVNDIAITGARPLFMLDYLATGTLELGVAQDVVAGIAEGCRQARLALIGGETAEMPGFYPPGEYDLAGFVVGVVDRGKIIDGSSVGNGAALVGLGSSGLHSNGYSLVRRIIFDDLGLGIDENVPELGGPVGEVLLTPTRIYTEALMVIQRDFHLLAAAHITGGGILENLPRVLPGSLKGVVRRGSWPVPPIFPFLQKAGNLSQEEMLRTFNSGLGLIMVVPGEEAEEVVDRLTGMGETASVVGEVASREPQEPAVEIVE
ncbi:MAG: phosphoribosylformylglycinamidine cyclo-ligase [Deltaproteobacteria bacterium]|nr:phosphoribosylformylglycinamidine cyclo-ligase [Deltaproteobacteria bacterium]